MHFINEGRNESFVRIAIACRTLSRWRNSAKSIAVSIYDFLVFQSAMQLTAAIGAAKPRDPVPIACVTSLLLGKSGSSTTTSVRGFVSVSTWLSKRRFVRRLNAGTQKKNHKNPPSKFGVSLFSFFFLSCRRYNVFVRTQAIINSEYSVRESHIITLSGSLFRDHIVLFKRSPPPPSLSLFQV